jgi:HTH-type transcriptional regulator / antitoxin HigA
MSTLAANHAYAELLARVPPRVVHTEEENERYIGVLYELEHGRETLTPEERDLADVLTLLIEGFEEKHYKLPRASPLETISLLMDHGSAQPQAKRSGVFGTPSIVSEVMSGKRDLNKDHIARLSERFHVSPELFF